VAVAVAVAVIVMIGVLGVVMAAPIIMVSAESLVKVIIEQVLVPVQLVVVIGGEAIRCVAISTLVGIWKPILMLRTKKKAARVMMIVQLGL
jgi:hypothetical protein